MVPSTLQRERWRASRRLRHPYLVIFALALLVRLAWILTQGPELTWSDEDEFVRIARHLVQGHGFVATSYRANPVLPAVLALVFHIFGESYLAARIFQGVLGALTCVLAARIGWLLLGPEVGVLSGFMLAVYLPHIYLSGVFYVECLFTFLCMLTIYLAVLAARSPGRTTLGVLCGIVFGVTILTRTIVIVYLPFLCAALLFAAGPLWRRQLGVCFAMVLALASTVLPWTIRNHRVYGRFVLVSSGFGTKLWQGNNPVSSGGPDDRELIWDTTYWQDRLKMLPGEEGERFRKQYEEVARSVDTLEQQIGDRYIASDQVLQPLAIEYMRSHPARTLKLFALKVGTLFSPFSKTLSANAHVSSRNQILAAMTSYPVFALALVGAVAGLRKGRALWIIYLFLASIIGAYGMLNACTRFRLPLDPCLIVLSALALHDLYEWPLLGRRRVESLEPRESMAEVLPPKPRRSRH